jgi:hypothetical protein
MEVYMTTHSKASAAFDAPFDLHATLNKHGWKGKLSLDEAANRLRRKSAYTYLIRIGEQKEKFTLTFVGPDGQIKNEVFVLIDWINGIFANGNPAHVGPLDILVPLKMNCKPSQAFPV